MVIHPSLFTFSHPCILCIYPMKNLFDTGWNQTPSGRLQQSIQFCVSHFTVMCISTSFLQLYLVEFKPNKGIGLGKWLLVPQHDQNCYALWPECWKNHQGRGRGTPRLREDGVPQMGICMRKSASHVRIQTRWWSEFPSLPCAGFWQNHDLSPVLGMALVLTPGWVQWCMLAFQHPLPTLLHHVKQIFR